MNQLDEYYKVVHFVRRYCWVYECSNAKIYYVSKTQTLKRKPIVIRQMAARAHQLTCWQMVIWSDGAAIWRMTMSLRLELAFFERTAKYLLYYIHILNNIVEQSAPPCSTHWAGSVDIYIAPVWKHNFFSAFLDARLLDSKNVEKKICFQTGAIYTSNEPASRVLQGGALCSTILFSIWMQ